MEDEALLQAIRLIGSQQKLAKLLGRDRRVVNEWLNKGYRIPVHLALHIEMLTRGAVTAEQLAPYAKQDLQLFKTYFANKLLAKEKSYECCNA